MLIFSTIKRIALIVCNFYLFSMNIITGIETKNISYCGIPFEVLGDDSSEISYILIHGDEETARMLLKNHIKKNNGKAFIIKSKTREVPFGPTIVDPNRLFSNIGARRALKNFKSDWDGDELDNLNAMGFDVEMTASSNIVSIGYYDDKALPFLVFVEFF